MPYLTRDMSFIKQSHLHCHVGSDADFAACRAIISKVKTTNDLRIYQHVSEYLVKFEKEKKTGQRVKSERSAGERVCRWMVVNRGYWADDSRPSCGKQRLIISATDQKAFEEMGHDPAM